MKKWFLTRQREFVECEIVEENPKKRLIKIIEPGHELENKTIKIWGEKIAGGKLYPRLFTASERPMEYFEYKGRILLKKSGNNPLVPKEEPYLFQPITSQLIDSIISSDKMLLTGESGTGKTSHIEQLAAKINQPTIRVNLNGETRIGDFLGKIHVEGGKTFWKDGILPIAMKQGFFLILDEIDMGESNILSLLHPVLEDQGRLVLKENDGEVIYPHSDFRIFATANSVGSMQSRSDAYTGTSTMNEAFLDRWHILEVPYMASKIEIKVIATKVPALRKRSIKNIVQFANLVRNSKSDGINLKVSPRMCIQWARKMALYRDPIKAAESVFLFKINAEEKEWVVRTIKTVFATKHKEPKEEKED